MSKPIDHQSRDRDGKTPRHLWCGIATFSVVVVAVVGAIVFEAMTGRFSGTVMQVRIDECTAQEILMTAFSVPGRTIELTIDGAVERTTTMQKPTTAEPATARLRAELWKSAGKVGSELNGQGKPGTLVPYVKTGDVFQLRIDESITLMSWEAADSTERWVMVAYIAP